MTTCTYWCLEKGHARWTGPDDGTEERARVRTIRILTRAPPLLRTCSFLWMRSPVLMVRTGGIGGGVFLFAVVVAVRRLRHTGVPQHFRTDGWLTAALVLSSLAILCVGVYGVLKTLGAVPE